MTEKKRKHIVIVKLFEFGGSNAHLKMLIRYFDQDEVILILEDKNQLKYLPSITGGKKMTIRIMPDLLAYAHLRYRFTTNVKDLFFIVKSILTLQLLSIKYHFADITISAVEPEKYLYLFWMPLAKMVYILHTAPNQQYTSFTAYTCNKRLGKRRKIITVSQANKALIVKNWNIKNVQAFFVEVISNSITEDLFLAPCKSIEVNNLLIVTAGHVVQYKNPVIWFEVAKIITRKYKEVKFIWMGNGPLFEKFKDAAAQYEQIVFAGYITNPYVILQNAAIYYQPSLQETNGIAVIEAMSKQLSCVVSNVGGLPESVQENYNGLLVEPKNKEQHVAALSSLIEKKEVRDLYGKNSYDKYLRSFSFDIFKNKMDNVYRHQ